MDKTIASLNIYVAMSRAKNTSRYLSYVRELLDYIKKGVEMTWIDIYYI